MIIGIRGPAWSYGLDALIQFFGVIIALIIAIYGYKIYKINKERVHLFFSSAFALISLDLIIYALVIPALLLYYQYGVCSACSLSSLLTVSHVLNFVYMFSTLMAYLLLIFAYSNIDRKSIMGLLIALVLSLVVFSFLDRSFIGFNLISLLLLLFIVFYTGRNYSQKKTSNSFLVLLSFILLALAPPLFILESFNNLFYLLGHVSQLLGYLSLLIMFIRVQHGRKKK